LQLNDGVDGLETADDWISAATALALLKNPLGEYTATRTIASRAADGLIVARAQRLVIEKEGNKQARDDVEILSEFWWGRGEKGLHQNWGPGDFDTWINSIHFRAFNVRFRKSDIDVILMNLPAPPAAPSAPKNFSRKVFVVHGHDDGAREAVARFLEQLDFEVVILNEQANRGRTVIEKVEANSDVGFAVVLLSPDDTGCVKGGTPEPRARQNVLLELGYFIGKLDRERVCTLKVGDFEIPSDWRGVVDEPFDKTGGWKQVLARELEAADYAIDWKVMRGPKAP
jgi:predicted nucleotide-binding protein